MSRTALGAGVVFLVCVLSGGAQAANTVTVELPLERPQTVTYSVDGKQIAVGGLTTAGDGPQDGLVVLLDAQTGQQQKELPHSGTVKRGNGSSSTTNTIHQIAYSPDGKLLAVGAELGLKLWNPLDGQELATLAGYELPNQKYPFEVSAVAFSPDGKRMAISRSSEKIELWDVQTRRAVRELGGGRVDCLTFSHDGALIVSVEEHNRVRLRDSTSGEQLAEINAEMGPLYGVAIDAAGKLVAAVGEGGEKLWRIERSAAGVWNFVDEGRLMGQGPMSPVRGVAFSPDGRLLATYGDNGATMLYDVATKVAVGTLWEGGPSAFSPDSKQLAVVKFGRQSRNSATKMTLWNVADVTSADRLAEQARTAASELVSAVKSDDLRRLYDVQFRTLIVLGGPQGAAAAPQLIEALAIPDSKKKTTIVTALGRLAKDSPAAVEALAKVIREDESADARTTAAMGLSMLTAAAAAPAVPVLSAAAVNDKSPHVQRAAATALKRIDPAAFQKALAEYRARGPVQAKVEKRNGKLYYQGRSLEEWVDRLSVSYIPNEIFGRPSPNEPIAAIRMFGAEAVPQLIDILKLKHGPEREAAAAALGALGPQAAPALDVLFENMANATAGVSAGSADAVAAIVKDQRQLPARLLEFADSADPKLRINAARAIAQTDPKHPRGLPVLQAALAASSKQPGVAFPSFTGAIPEPAKPEWLGKLLADNEAPTMERLRAAESLARMKEEALPALPAIIRAVQSANDDSVRQSASLAIQRLGPKAVPGVRDAFKAEKDRATRERLAVALFSMGDDGQRAIKELVQGDEGEALWWMAACNAMDRNLQMSFAHMVREALAKCGQPAAPARPGAGFNFAGPRPTASDRPSLAWSGAMLVDSEAPQYIRMQSVIELSRHSPDELLPMLPALLEALNKETDRTMRWQYVNVIRRIGTKALPAVQTAIEKAPSDEVRLELLRVLPNMGVDGQREFARLMQAKPEYARLLSPGARPPTGNKTEKTSTPPPVKKKTVVKAGGGPSFDVVLHGKAGQEIKGRVDTASDTFTISSWSDPAKNTWTLHAEALPLTLHAFSADGQQFDVPADWNGKISGWAFLLPHERDLVNVPWNEGVPPDLWKGASFGWGGLRNSAGKVVAGNAAADTSNRIRYVPAGERGASDIALDDVKITPVEAASEKQ